MGNFNNENAASITGSLAGITSLIPGVGGILGTGLGMASSMFGNKSAEEEQARIEAEKKGAMAAQKAFVDMTNANAANASVPNTPLFAAGGYSNAQQGGMGLQQFMGKNHEQGGTPFPGGEAEKGETLLPDGYIFSDRLKPKGSKKTYAKLSTQLRNKFKGREHDKVEQAELNAQLLDLKNKQEEHRLALQAKLDGNFGDTNTKDVKPPMQQQGQVPQFATGGYSFFSGIKDWMGNLKNTKDISNPENNQMQLPEYNMNQFQLASPVNKVMPIDAANANTGVDNANVSNNVSLNNNSNWDYGVKSNNGFQTDLANYYNPTKMNYDQTAGEMDVVSNYDPNAVVSNTVQDPAIKKVPLDGFMSGSGDSRWGFLGSNAGNIDNIIRGLRPVKDVSFAPIDFQEFQQNQQQVDLDLIDPTREISEAQKVFQQQQRGIAGTARGVGNYLTNSAVNAASSAENVANITNRANKQNVDITNQERMFNAEQARLDSTNTLKAQMYNKDLELKAFEINSQNRGTNRNILNAGIAGIADQLSSVSADKATNTQNLGKLMTLDRSTYTEEQNAQWQKAVDLLTASIGKTKTKTTKTK